MLTHPHTNVHICIQLIHTCAQHMPCPHITPLRATPTVHAALPTCSTFGNNLVQATGTQAPGLYLNIGNAASCAGNATAWNVCYYSNISDGTMTSYLTVYRPTTDNKYDPIGSITTYSATRNTTLAYVCDHIPILQSQQYMVQPQDVLAVCLKSVGSGYQGMVASPVPGASILMTSSACTSGNPQIGRKLNIGSPAIASTTLHVSIGTWNHWVHFRSSASWGQVIFGILSPPPPLPIPHHSTHSYRC